MDNIKQTVISASSQHPYIATAIIIVVVVILLLIGASALGYSPKQTVSNMISGRSGRKDMNEDELDELICSINEKQKANCAKQPQRAAQ